jgi:hypothetical protein
MATNFLVIYLPAAIISPDPTPLMAPNMVQDREAFVMSLARQGFGFRSLQEAQVCASARV